MADNLRATHSSETSMQSPEFHTPPPPPGDPPATTFTDAQTSTQVQVEPPTSSLPQSSVLPTTHEPQVSAAAPSVNPFSDAAAPAQPVELQAPPQHPDRPLPLGGLTDTPLHSEPAPILPPRPVAQPEPQSQVLPPPRASFDQPIPDHPAMRQSSLGRVQSPGQTIQHVAVTPVQPQPIAPPPQAPVLDSNAQTLESDPAIASLHAMFPDFDLLVIQSVLEATGGDKDQAVDSLLSMSDPEYAQAQPQAATAPAAATGLGVGTGNQGRQPTQTELDEEFARRLMLEEEQQANASAWPPAGGQYPGTVPYQQYQPRRSGEHQRPQNVGAGGGAGAGFGDMAGDLQQQFRNFIGGNSARRAPAPGAQAQAQGGGAAGGAGYQDQFNKIADTGKKTLNTIFNKVKQKMEEFDNRHPSDTQNMNHPQQSGHWSNWQAPPAAQQHVPTYAQSPAPQQYAPPARSPSPPAHHGALNSNPYGIPPSTTSANPNLNTNAGAGSTLPASSGRWQYQPEQPETLPPPPAPTAATGTTEEPRRSVDATRLGLLPKRPVSLMDVNANTRSAQPPAQTHAQDSDNESLEYVDRPMPGSMARP